MLAGHLPSRRLHERCQFRQRGLSSAGFLATEAAIAENIFIDQYQYSQPAFFQIYVSDASNGAFPVNTIHYRTQTASLRIAPFCLIFSQK